MKVLLMSLNSKFIHTNLAVQSIKMYYEKHSKHSDQTLVLKEYTINHEIDTVLRDIIKGNYTHIFASAYIWNVEMMDILFKNIKSLRPDIRIIFGGPEVSYNAKEQLTQKTYLDVVMVGEGERIFTEFVDRMISNGEMDALRNTRGIVYKELDRICVNDPMPLIDILDEMPFPYTHVSDFSNRILYYESSRGCPFNCSYCLSSAVDGLRHLSLERVKSDLNFFLMHKVPQVKFVDRTFNAKKDHALSIIKYIVAHDNGVTNFHFEMTASLLDQDYIEVLAMARPGLFQLEIGVQTTHQPTMHAIHRPIAFEKIKWACEQIQKYENIHLHLDLIAGLPFETFEIFLNSFDDVYHILPDELQLGFLKVLKGTEISKLVDDHKYKVGVQAPYEVLANQWITIEELSQLKDMETLLEYYFNSNKFTHALRYFIKKTKEKPSVFYLNMATYFNRHMYLASPIGTYRLYELLYAYFESMFGESDLFKELLKVDYYHARLKGQKPLFEEIELKHFNQMRMAWLKEPSFRSKYLDVDSSVTAKDLLKNLEFTTLKYDLMTLIQSD